jgi:DNA/RNA endonuclease YhcR with UshA esterase domain
MRAFVTIVFLTFISLLAADTNAKDKPLTPAEARKNINKNCTVEMQVKSVGKGRGVFFLNSNMDYNTSDNFTIFINKTGVESLKRAKVEDPPAHYKDKTIRVSGFVKLYSGRPEIVVEEAKQIQVVEKK